MNRLDNIKQLYSEKKNNIFYIRILISKIISKMATLLAPYLFLVFINQIYSAFNGGAIIIVSLGYIVLYFLETYFMWKGNLTLIKFSMKNQRIKRMELTRNFSHWNMCSYNETSPLDTKKTIIDDTEVIGSTMENHIYDFFISIIISVISLVILIFIDWKLSIISMITYFISFLLVMFLSEKNKKINSTLRDMSAEIEDFEKNIFDNWKDIKTNGIENVILENFYDIQKRYYKLFGKQQNYEIIDRVMRAFKDFFMEQIVVYLCGGILIFQGELTLVMLLIFIEYYKIFLMNTTFIQSSYFEFNGTIVPLIERIKKFGKEKTSYNSINKMVDFTNYDINVNNVTYSYRNSNEKIFENLDLSITFGEFVAIIGESGSGKSTLIKLLLGALTPDGGRVSISDINVSQMGDDLKSNLISIVSQTPLLFNMSIKDNLLLSNLNRSIAELRNVCEEVGILGYIESLPDAFDTIIFESGQNLSGGQRMRLSLARIILLDPKIIILDEVTAGLDRESEKIVMETIKKLSKRKTVILISHNESSVSYAKRIFKIESRKINEVLI